jgi:CRISPR-associated protein Cas1
MGQTDIFLQSFGARLRVKDGIFQVTVPDLSGANATVQESFAPHEVRSILMQPGASASTDAMLLAIDHQIDFLVQDKFGNIQGRFFSSKPANSLVIWQNQLLMAQHPEGLRLAKSWVENKLKNRIAFLHKLKARRSPDKAAIIEEAAEKMLKLFNQLCHLNVHRPLDACAGIIRGIEGSFGRLYYQTLSALLPDEYKFEGRSTHPAQDPFNAFLNYGYGILYNLVERALMLAGVHPHIGLMHADGPQRKSMVFDFIESFRIWVEKTVFQLFSRKLIAKNHTESAIADTAVLLNEAGRRLLAQAFRLRISEKKQDIGDGRNFTLDLFLQEQARRLGATLRQFEGAIPQMV